MTEGCHAGLDVGFATMSYWQMTLLGFVQGITELLPVSSSAHMRVVPAFLGWSDPGAAFSAAMQLAALCALLSYFWREIRWVAVEGVQDVLKRRSSPASKLLFSIGIATVPICIAGLGLSHVLNQCDSPLRHLWVIGVACCMMGGLLALAERYVSPGRTLEQITYKDALWVGLAQVGALIPGVSRSGATLTAALFLKLERAEAARFSFLLGLPAIMLAGGKEIWVLWHAHIPIAAWQMLGVGLVAASCSAFVAIWGLMHLLERYTTWPFVIYRILLGLYLLYLCV